MNATGHFRDKIADRLGGVNFEKAPIYKFERIKRLRAESQRNHPGLELLDFGVGEPDLPADPEVVRTLANEAGRPENRWYADNGIPEFQNAATEYLSRVYGVRGLDPQTQVLHGVGSKSILSMLPLCFLNPGDVFLMPTPGYPIGATHAQYLGGQIHHFPLLAANGFLPDLDSIPSAVLKRAKLLYLNYPNNPTGAVATKEFFQNVVEFAFQHRLVVIHDAAYGALTFAGTEPLSFMSVDGAIEVGVEVHSLSKAFQMTGWRIGFICGPREAIRAVVTVKDNTDSGQFRAIQKAAVTALTNTEITEKAVVRYSRRLDLLVATLREVGFTAEKPLATFYCYVPIPLGTTDGQRFQSAMDFAEFLLARCLVSVVPWDEAGAFVRFSVTFSALTPTEEARVIEELKNRLLSLNLTFSTPQGVLHESVPRNF